MKTIKAMIGAGVLMCAGNVQADISLFEWGLNKDGVITGSGDPLPVGSVFDIASGLGSVHLEFSGAGLHQGILFVDHELSESVNTFFNELGVTIGVPSAGQSWEIDEPGFSQPLGDIFPHFQAGTLDNSIGRSLPDDVSMAMGWNFILGAGETGVINFLVSETAPPSGFYLRHSDPDSEENIYFSTALSISETGSGVPDGGGTALLLAGGLVALAGMRRSSHREFI